MDGGVIAFVVIFGVRLLLRVGQLLRMMVLDAYLAPILQPQQINVSAHAQHYDVQEKPYC
jgi:hypothetical protein